MIKKFFEKIVQTKNNDVKVIAEMSGNHQGTYEGANKFVKQYDFNQRKQTLSDNDE